MTTARPTSPHRRLVVPVVVLLALAGVLAAVRMVPTDTPYVVELPHAAGLRSGDAVRVAGLDVGTVESVEAVHDTVRVEISVEDDVRLTDDTTTQIKLISLLGQRYLALDPGEGSALSAGDTLSKRSALDSYTIERFWLDSTPRLDALDLTTLEQAIDVLSTDLRTAPADVRSALEGMAGVSDIVNDRQDQLDRLLTSTQDVTDTVLDQQDELDALMTSSDLVMTMVHRRRQAIRLLLRDSRALVTRLTRLARRNEGVMAPALRDLEDVLTVLDDHKADLDELLRLAGPSMRFFTNVTGDGPWMGVNAPYAIFPDDLLCVTRPLECS